MVLLTQRPNALPTELLLAHALLLARTRRILDNRVRALSRAWNSHVPSHPRHAPASLGPPHTTYGNVRGLARRRRHPRIRLVLHICPGRPHGRYGPRRSR